MMSSPKDNGRVQSPGVDSLHSWIVCAAVTLIFALTMGYIRCYGVLMVAFKDMFGSTATTTFSILGVCFISFSVMSLVACNILVDRLQARTIVVLGGLFASGAVMAGTFAGSIGFLMATNGFLFGLGASFVFGPGTVVLGFCFERRRTLAIGVAFAGNSAGAIVLPIFVQFLLDEYGFRGAMLLTGAVILHSVPAGMLLLKPATKSQDVKHEKSYSGQLDESSTPMVNNSLSEGQARREMFSQSVDDIYNLQLLRTESPTTHFSSLPKDIHMTDPPSERDSDKQKKRFLLRVLYGVIDKALLTSPVFYAYMAFECFSVSGAMAQNSFLPSLAREKGLQPQEGAFLVSILSIVDVLSKVLAGHIADVVSVGKHWIVAACMVLVGTLSQLTRFYCCYSVMIGYAALLGCGVGCYTSVRISVVINFFGKEKFSAIFGLVQFLHGLTNAINYPLTGAIRDSANSYIPAFHYLGSCCYVAAVLLLVMALLTCRKDHHPVK